MLRLAVRCVEVRCVEVRRVEVGRVEVRLDVLRSGWMC